jgi:hypothetical protein
MSIQIDKVFRAAGIPFPTKFVSVVSHPFVKGSSSNWLCDTHCLHSIVIKTEDFFCNIPRAFSEVCKNLGIKTPKIDYDLLELDNLDKYTNLENIFVDISSDKYAKLDKSETRTRLIELDYPIVSKEEISVFIELNRTYRKIFRKNMSGQLWDIWKIRIKRGVRVTTAENIWVREKPDTQFVKIFISCKNCISSIRETFDCMYTLQCLSNDTFEYFIFENGSTDNTPTIIKSWLIDKFGTHSSFHSSTIDYRNSCFSLCKNWSNSIRSIIVDTGISVPVGFIFECMSLLSSSTVMVSPYAETVAGKYYNLKYFETIDGSTKFKLSNTTLVKRAFGGIAVISTHVLQKVSWNDKGLDVSEFGRVLLKF